MPRLLKATRQVQQRVTRSHGVLSSLITFLRDIGILHCEALDTTRLPKSPDLEPSRLDDDEPGASMHIGVNLYALTLRGGGMRQYVIQLLPWLVRLSYHRFVLFHAAHGQPSVALILRQLSADERRRV